MRLAEIMSGPMGKVLAEVDGRGICKVMEDLKDLGNSSENRVDATKFVARAKQWCFEGRKGVHGDTWDVLRSTPPKVEEWKFRNHRALWYNDGRLIIISHVVRKKRQKANKRDIDRCAAFATRYLRSRQG